MTRYLKLVCLLGMLSNSTGLSKFMSEEGTLIRKLMQDYDPRIRPANSTNPVIMVALGLAMTEIAELHEKGETFETGAFLQHLWSDPRLSWNPAKFGGITTVHLPAESVWKPDIVLINSADTVLQKVEPLVIIFQTGVVFYSPKYRLRSPCTLNLMKFPFDEQICKLTFGSWTYDNGNINLTHFASGKKGLDLKGLRMNNEWKLVESLSVRIDKQYEYGGNNKFPMIEYSFRLQRNPTYYRHVFILPAVLLAIIVPFQFLLPPDSKERITLGSILMLGIILLLVMLQEFLPEAHPTVPTIASYYTVTLVWIMLSLLASIWVVNTQSRGPRRKKVPEIIRHFFLRGLKRLVCLGDDTYYPLNESDAVSMKGLDLHAGDPIVKQEVTGQSKLEKDVEEILRHIHAMTIRASITHARQEIQNEWHQVALVIDRILCFLFCATFLLYTFVLLA